MRLKDVQTNGLLSLIWIALLLKCFIELLAVVTLHSDMLYLYLLSVSFPAVYSRLLLLT